jgi:hypothetical protein
MTIPLRIITFLFVFGQCVFGNGIANAAEDCPFRLQVTYPGGEKGCLTDIPLAKKTSKKWGRSIADVAKYANNYVIIAGETCDAPEIYTTVRSNHPFEIQRLFDSVSDYVKECSAECNCAMVVKDGAVLLNKNLAMVFGDSKTRVSEVAQTPKKVESAQQSSSKENNKQTQLQSSVPSSPQISTSLAGSVPAAVDPTRQRESDLLAQISAELARLRAETEAVKEERKALTQTIVNVNIQKPVAVMANRKALVIGNDNYKFVTPLLNAREDAKTMALELGNVGYNVTLKLDVTEKELKSILRTFKNQIEAGDEVAFFYAGHGVQLDNSNFLLPVDVAGDGEDQVRDEAIALQRILDDIASKKAKFTLAMIDACRDNPFKGSGRSIGGGTRGLAPTTAATGQMVIFSAGSGQQALDKLSPSDKSKNGLFTRVFAREIKTPGVSVDRLVRNVRNEVVNLAKSVGHEQVPAIYDQVVGEFYFKK